MVEVLFVMSESLLVRVSPVLVESLLGVVIDGLSPDGGQSSETSGGINVTDDTDDGHGGTFDDGNGFNNFLLVVSGTRSVDFSQDMGHTSLETSESGQVGLLGGIILRERSASTSVMSCSSSGSETEGAVSGGFEFSVRHFI